MRNEYYHFPTFNRLFYRAVHIGLICIWMFAGTTPISAQIYSTVQGNRYKSSQTTEHVGMLQSHNATQEMQLNYNSYQPTVYRPFESSLPSHNNSTYSTDGYSNSGSYHSIRGRRNTGEGDETDPNAPDNPGNGELPEGWFDPNHPSDPGHQSNQSPVGEAWVMLFFAAVVALVVWFRNRRPHLEDTPKIP